MPRFLKSARRRNIASSGSMVGRARRLEHRPLRAEMLEGRCLLSLGATIEAVSSPADELPHAVADNYATSPGVAFSRDVLSPPGPLAGEDARLGVPFTTPRLVSGGQEVVETSGYQVNPGMVIVRGPGSHFWTTNWLEVGTNSRGRIVVEQGGRMTTSNWSAVGYNSGGVGDVIISGVGSQWTLVNHFTVGDNSNSQGNVRVENGGVLSAGNWAEVGRYTSAVGEVTVVGAGSRMTVASFLNVGGSGGKGTLRVGDGGFVSAGATTIGSGGQLIGDGTVQASIANLGVISPGGPRGILTIRGGLSLTSSGTIEFDLGGTERGAAYDGIDVVGNVSGVSRLLLRFVDGFAPRAGDEFRLIEFSGSGAVTFSTIEVRGLAPGFQYEIVNAAGAIVLRALTDGVSAPVSTLPLGVLANDQVQAGGVLSPMLLERPTDGTLTLYSNGSFRYVPNASFQGVDAFQYQATDGFGLSAPVTAAIVVGTNPPSAAGDAFSLSEESTLSVSAASGLLANDSDPLGRVMTAALFSAPAHGTASVATNGSFTYTPAANFFGTDSFRYRVTAGGVKSNLATVTLTVANVNDVPVAQGDTYKTRSNTPLAVAAAQGVLANDSDPDAEAITAELISGPTSGTLELAADGSFNYVPATDFHGTATFTYQTRDAATTSSPATVTIRVNDPPVTMADANTMAEDGTLNVPARGVLTNDTDVENDTLTAVLLDGPLAGSVTLNANGSFMYTPGADFYGTDSFSYAASDGVNQTEATTVAITVSPVNDPPVAAGDTYRIRPGGQLNINRWQGVLANDTDIENSPLTATLVVPPASGTLILASDGSLTYTPAAGFAGAVGFAYRASDGAANSTEAAVTINVGLAAPSAGSFINPSGGSFETPSNWFGGALPDTYSGEARFDQARQYSVTFPSGETTFGRLVIGDDDVTFEMGGGTFARDTTIGETAGQRARLTLRNGKYENQYGRFSSVGDIVVDSTATLSVQYSYDSVLAGSALLQNNGTADFFPSSSGNLVLTDQAVVENAGTLAIADSGQATLDMRREASLTNTGTVNMGGSGIIIIRDDATLTNRGTINVSGGGDAGDVISSSVDVYGSLNPYPGSTLSSSSVRINSGGELSGNGTIRGAVASRGTVSVAAAPFPLIVDRDFTQSIDGTLQVAVAGANRGIDYGGLSVAGRADISGKLILEFVEGFIPAPGDSFTLVTAGVLSVNLDDITVELRNADSSQLVQLSVAGNELIATITTDAVVAPFPVPLTAVPPWGSLVYRGILDEAIGTPADSDTFRLDLDASQTLAAVVDPATGLRSSIELRGPGGEILDSAVATVAGEAAVAQAVVSTAGPHFIVVGSSANTAGPYRLRVLLGAAADTERYGGATNNTPAAAYDLDTMLAPLGSVAAQRGAYAADVPPSASPQVIYSANMDVNPRWRLEGGWAHGRPTGGGSHADHLDPTRGVTGRNVVGYNLSGDYPSNILTPEYATVGPIDARGFKAVTLSFYRWLNVGYGDKANLQVSRDGQNWTTLQSLPSVGSGEQRDFTWLRQNFDISGIADNQPTVFVRWGMGPSDSFFTSAGWNIDDVVITGTPLGPPDIDWYRFDLDDGQIAAVALSETAASAASPPTLDLYDGNLNFLASGAPSGAYARLIDSYLDTTTNGAPDTYFVRVTTLASTPYNLVVTRDAFLEIEPNNRSSQAQLLTAADTVLGHLGDGQRSVYRHDDGHDERASQRRDGGDILWLNSFTAQPGADRIAGISLAWSTFVFEGAPTTVLLYDDPNDDRNPNDAVLLASADTHVVAPGTGQFTTVPITPTRVQGEFFVAALFSQKRSEIVAPLDSTLPARRSWFAGSATPGAFDIHNLSANSSPPALNDVGNFLLRAVASPEETGEDWYRVGANVGDEIAVQTATPSGGPGQFVNLLDPALEVFDPSGVLIAQDTQSADGRNASLAFQAATTGSYRIRVTREAGTTGEYVLSVQGGSRGNAPPEVETAAPDDNEALAQFPAYYALDLSEAIDLATVEGTDLVVGGRPALTVMPLDDHTLQFQVDPAANTGDGQYTVELPANALADTAGLGNFPYKGTFVLDTTPPRAIYSSIAEASTVAGSNATYTAIFSEPLNTHALDAADFQLVGENSGPHVPAGVSFPGGFAVTLRYADLPEDDYTLTVRGGDCGLEDLAGNGPAGGNLEVHFSADAAVDRFRTPLAAVSPLGSLVYQNSLSARINQPGDSDTFTFDPPAGSAITIVAEPQTPLAAFVVLRDPDGAILASGAMSSTSDAVLPTITASKLGSYSVTVGDAMSSPGRYSVMLLLNAAVEAEAHGGPANDSAAAAEDLATGFQGLVPDADRSAVRGGISAGGSDWFRFALEDGQAASIALANLGAGDVTLQAYDSSLNLRSTGVVAGNADRVIDRLLDSTTNQTLDTYYVRVAGTAASHYNLHVTRGAMFDIEGNNRLSEAQIIGSTSVVLGHLARPDTISPLPSTSGSPSVAPVQPETPALPPLPTTLQDIGASEKPPYVPGRLLVRFAQTARASEVAASIGADDGTIHGYLPLINAAVVELPDSASDIQAAAARWGSQPGVLYAEPDYVYHLDTTLPNDLFFARQLGVHNIGGIGGIADSDIDAPEAWDVINRSGRVVIAHIDTGVDYTHPDLAANIWTNPREIVGDGIDNDGNGYIDDVHGIDAVNNDSDPFDDNGHGTHTAGIIGAVGNNGLGVAGVSWGIQIMPLKLNDVDGEAETSNAVTLLNYAVRMKTQYGIKIVASNNSWGGPTYSQALRDAIAAANAAGIMIVASAGNNGRDNDVSPHYPSSYDLPGVIAVAATDKNDTLGSFQNYSNYGITTVDLAAPGTTILSTLPGGDYGYLTGTSMAAPHVTGAVALLAALDPQASLAQIKDALLSGVDPNPTSAGKTVTGGRLNLANSIALWSDDFYRFEVAAGQSLTIRTLTPDVLPAGSSNLDPAIALFSPSGELLAADNNSDPDGRNALLSFVAPQSGSYTIRVSAISGQGDYVLTATQSAPVPAPSPAIAVALPLPVQRRLAKEQTSVGPGQAPSVRRPSPLAASRQASSAGALHSAARLLARLRQKSVDRIVAELFDPLTSSNESPS